MTSLSSTLMRFAAFTGAVVLCTCGTVDRFDVTAGASADIPKATLLDEALGALPLSGFDKLDFSDQIRNQGVTEDQIDSVKIKSFVIHTKEGSNLTLDFIKSAKFYAEADGQPKVLIASSNDFAGQTSVDLDVEEDVELRPYVAAPSLTISAEVEGKKPPQDTTITADVTLDVDAAIPGCK